MDFDLHRPRGPQGEASLHSWERGFSVLEVLVIVVIVCAVAGVGIPVLHSRAKASVLDANVHTLAEQVNELATEGYSPVFRASGDGDPTVYLSLQLEEVLRSTEKGGYVNPNVGSSRGRAILSSGALPSDSRAAPPAVFMTDSPSCEHQAFASLPLATRRLLAGTLIVAFNVDAHTVEVFSVDGHGQESATMVSIPTG